MVPDLQLSLIKNLSLWSHRLSLIHFLCRHRDRFLYGGAVTLEVDAYLTDRIILSLTGRERILWGTTTGHFHAQFGLGVKFIIH